MAAFFNQASGDRPSTEWFNMVFLALSGLTTSGATVDRPTTGLWVGRTYFDTTLGYSINWNGTVWVNGSGTPV